MLHFGHVEGQLSGLAAFCMERTYAGRLVSAISAHAGFCNNFMQKRLSSCTKQTSLCRQDGRKSLEAIRGRSNSPTDVTDRRLGRCKAADGGTEAEEAGGEQKQRRWFGGWSYSHQPAGGRRGCAVIVHACLASARDLGKTSENTIRTRHIQVVVGGTAREVIKSEDAKVIKPGVAP